MRIEQLEFLVEIAQKKSFNSASENLYLTPQSLSRSITSMENELGFKLFERNFCGVRFTNEGKKFLEAAEEITSKYHQTLQEIAAYQKHAKTLPSGSLTVYAHPIFSMSVLPDAIAEFCSEYPQIKVCLLEDVSGSILEKLNKEEQEEQSFKIGMVTIPQTSSEMQKHYKENERQRFVSLLNGEYVCCVSKKSPLAAKRNISLKTICQYPLVRFTDNIGNVSDVQSYFLARYGETQTSFSTTSIGLWISAIANDAGVGLIHHIVLANKSLIRDIFAQVAVIPIREKTALETGLLVPQEQDSIVHFFVEFMQKHFKTLEW